MSGFIDDLDEQKTVEVGGERIANRRTASRDFDGPDQRRPRGRRAPRHGLKWFSGIIGSLVIIFTGTQTLEPIFPETRAHAEEAHASLSKRIDTMENDMGTVKGDVGDLKKDVRGLVDTGKKTQLATARSRRQEVQDRLSRATVGSDVWKDYSRELDELNDDIEALRKELGR